MSRRSSGDPDRLTGAVAFTIPRPPRKQSAYNVYYQPAKDRAHAENPELSSSELLALVRAQWQGMNEEEREPYEETAQMETDALMSKWGQAEDVREARRKTWCRTLGVPENSSWKRLEKEFNKQEQQRQRQDMQSVSNGHKASPDSNGYSQKHRLLGDDDSSELERGSAKKLKSATDYPSKSRGSPSSPGPMRKMKSNGANGLEGGGGGKETKLFTTGADSQWDGCWKPHTRKKAVLRGLDKIFAMGQSEDNFTLFGNDIIQCFYDVATVTGEPVRARALMYVEQLAQRWKHTVMFAGWKRLNKATPQEVVDAIIGMYCLERVGIHHDVKEEVETTIGTYKAKDYLGWDPMKSGPPDKVADIYTGEKQGRYRTMSNSLINTFYADRVGLVLGCPYQEVFKWLPGLRPYKGPKDLKWQEYIDQCYLVTHVIFTLNNWGELRLDPELFPHEYYFVREHISVQIRQKDVHLVGEFIEVLRSFGSSDNDPLIRAGLAFLLEAQEEDGCWDKGEGTDDYTTYHATMVAIQALLAHSYRGNGPGITGLTGLLLDWYETERAREPAPAKQDQTQEEEDLSGKEKSWRLPNWGWDDRVSALKGSVRNIWDTLADIVPEEEEADETGPPSPPSAAATEAEGMVPRELQRQDSVQSMDLGSDSAGIVPPTGANKAAIGKVEGILTSIEALEAQGNRWDAVETLMKDLDTIDVTREVLHYTNLGRAMKQLRKAPAERVAALAKSLVSKWREHINNKPK